MSIFNIHYEVVHSFHTISLIFDQNLFLASLHLKKSDFSYTNFEENPENEFGPPFL